ncbi:hemerythrin domain-containing protein [Dongia sedimenti]|uniref:Hemerythrin domain-containing protein n=1 Tax=Dongia sedimenti TaxID=3064282 RepID=A0ABU0YJ73_9PROT|nr:hemerythrin domain-containing protein [Rhodospirillaceae bacterium R-7]
MAKASAQKKSVDAEENTRNPGAKDAIALLKADHKEVAAMFEEFLAGDLDDDAKDELAGKICQALSVHAQIEEEIFYPAAREAVSSDDEDLLDEAEVEHGSITDLVTAVEEHEDDALFDAQIKVMSEWVKHHVKEEETELFPKLLKTDMDMKELGAAMAARKEELMEEYDAASDDDEADEDAGDEKAADEEDEDEK